MKNQALPKWSLWLLLLGLPLAGGCAQQAMSSTESNLTAAGASTEATNVALLAAADTNVPEGVTNAPSPVDITEAPVKAVSTERPTPATVRTNGPVAEMVKLAEAGVEQSVMLAFVTNTPSMFSLSADEIVYLNDIGLSTDVVTAMIHHDQALREAQGAVAAVQQAPTPAEVAPQAQESAQQSPPPAAQVQAAPAQAPTQTTFYQELSPYGTWVQVEGYGLCWQPSAVAVNPSWQPYFNSGRWVYSDYGWYWASDYSWGWAPFHYGRWFRHSNLGWCWYPGYVWGPSWVTWRYSGSYCGWAPLPPCAVYSPGFGLTYWGSHVGVGFTFGLSYSCYSFVSWDHFHYRHLHHYRVPIDRRDHPVYRDSRVATRIEGNRSHIANRGLDVNRVQQATHTPVKRVALRETSNVDSRMRADRLASDGRSLTVYRPRLAEANAKADPATVPATATSGNRSSFSRTSLSREMPREMAPAGALKPVTAVTPTRETASASEAVGRPVPARSLVGESANRSSIQRAAPVSSGPTRTEVTRTPSSLVMRGERPAAQSSPATPAVPNVPREVSRNSSVAAGAPQASGRSAWTPSTRQQAPSQPQYAPAPSRSSSIASAAPQAEMPRASTPQYTPPSRDSRPSYSAQPAGPRFSAPSQPREVPRSAPSAPAAQSAPSYSPPSRTYNPPAQSYSPPARSYSPPAQTYSPPARSYSPPAQSYSPPARSYSPPAQSYSPPARSYSPPPQSSYSAPSRSYSPPAPRSSPSSSGSSSGRGGRNSEK